MRAGGPPLAGPRPFAMTTPSPRPLPLGKRIVFAAVACALSLALIEGLLAALGIRPIVETEDPYVGFAGGQPLFVPAEAGGRETAPAKQRLFNRQRFAEPKPPGTFRIFTLGGSTTYGHPFHDETSFSGWLRAYLTTAAPTQRWEVINCGGISYASYRVAELMKELSGYQPDLFIAYTGHNEFLEERTYADLRDQSPLRRRLEGAAQHTRLYAALRRALPRNAAAAAAGGKSTLAAEVSTVLDTSVGPAAYHRDDAQRDHVVAHYAHNLGRMHDLARRAGAGLLLVTPAASLRDCSPFKSESTPGLAEADRQEAAERRARGTLDDLARAAQLDPRHAGGRYALAEALFAAGRYEEARPHYEAARDEDIVPVRAIGPLLDAMRKVARERKLPLLDFAAIVDTLARAATPAPLPGAELFLDHVHPTIEANRALARRLLNQIAPTAALTPAVETACSNAVYAVVDHHEQGIGLRNVAKVLSWAGKSQEAARLAEDAGTLLGEDAECHFLVAVAAEERDDFEAAAARYQRAIELDPTFWKAWNNLGVLRSRQKRHEEAVACYQRVAEGDPGRLNIHFNLGRAWLRLRKPAEAAAALEQAVARATEDADAWFLLGEAREDLGLRQEAATAYQRAAELNPADQEAAEAAQRLQHAPR
jgi:tetratricopeptide (TPR) repeat protein